jgi:hypothetical protein
MTEPSRFSQATGRPRLTITLEDLEADAATTPVSPCTRVSTTRPRPRATGAPRLASYLAGRRRLPGRPPVRTAKLVIDPL